mmetsp:Transcript_29957/g.95599  ORF Transcript_29957/g.95599 Transcript_29957/m.95599 type:complete len:215 (+) Transcript_29957:97-741(+)
MHTSQAPTQLGSPGGARRHVEAEKHKLIWSANDCLLGPQRLDPFLDGASQPGSLFRRVNRDVVDVAGVGARRLQEDDGLCWPRCHEVEAASAGQILGLCEGPSDPTLGHLLLGQGLEQGPRPLVAGSLCPRTEQAGQVRPLHGPHGIAHLRLLQGLLSGLLLCGPARDGRRPPASCRPCHRPAHSGPGRHCVAAGQAPHGSRHDDHGQRASNVG